MTRAINLARASACASVMVLALSPLYAASQDALLSPVSLQTALASAESSWAAPASTVTTIRAARLNACRPNSVDLIAWSDFASRIITINSACGWTRAWLQQVVTHEVGHMLLARPGHSEDWHSIMYRVVYGSGQEIQPVDRSVWGGM